MADRRRQHDDAEPAHDSEGVQLRRDDDEARLRHDSGARLRHDSGKRLCAVTREAVDPQALIRFVADPAGNMVPDLARRLPGRGVWVKADKAVVTKAVQANVFARSLKRPVRADAGLAETVDSLLEKRVLSALALANKAGLVTSGFQQVDALVEAGTAVILVQAADAAEGGREKLARKFIAVQNAKGREPALVTTLSTEQLSLAIGRSNVVHAALIQGGAALRFLDEAERLMRYRSGLPASGGAESAQDLEV